MMNKCDNCVMANCCEEFTEKECSDIKAYGDAIKAEVRAEAIDEYSNELFTAIERCTVNCKLNLSIHDLHNLEIIIKGLAEQMKGK